MKTHLILARDDLDGIGRMNTIPWTCPRDLHFFRKQTMDTEDEKKNLIVVGHNTYTHLPPLPGRNVSIMQRDGTFDVPEDTHDIYIAGGRGCIQTYWNI